MNCLEKRHSDVLHVDLDLDVELVEVLVICSHRYPRLSFAALARLALVREALRITGALNEGGSASVSAFKQRRPRSAASSSNQDR